MDVVLVHWPLEVERRAALTVTHVPTKPLLDPDGVLRLGAGCVALPPVEARLAAVLLESFGAVVSRHSLSIAGWPAGDPGRNALNVRMLRLGVRVLAERNSR